MKIILYHNILKPELYHSLSIIDDLARTYLKVYSVKVVNKQQQHVAVVKLMSKLC